jgi:predicted polyphosphate/ATP-dependent NAD kinase
MPEPKRLALIVNPIAGLGGRVGLKGTDGVVDRALELGAEPLACKRAAEALARFLEIKKGFPKQLEAAWITCDGAMGRESFLEAGFNEDEFSVVYTPEDSSNTTAMDTVAACKLFVKEDVDLVIFCGGDGTARDISEVIGKDIPIMGIPAGVKMHSGVFTVTPRAAGEMIVEFLYGNLEPAEVEIMDLDEERYRKGDWNIKLFSCVLTPWEPGKVQSSKLLITESQQSVLDDIAFYIQELMEEEPGTLFLLGPGGTLRHIGDYIDIDKTLLGIDAVVNRELVEKDVNEEKILALLEKFSSVRLVVSPIGAQGFFLGRGNLQLSPSVIRRIGIDNIIIIVTPSKLARTEVLRVDTGDHSLDREFLEKERLNVVIGERTMRLVPLRE